MAHIGSDCAGFQIRSVWSSDADARSTPCGLKVHLATQSRCAECLPTRQARSMSHAVTWLDSDPTTMISWLRGSGAHVVRSSPISTRRRISPVGVQTAKVPSYEVETIRSLASQQQSETSAL